jgi:hypothetical protein
VFTVPRHFSLYFFKAHFNISHLRLYLTNYPSPSGFRLKFWRIFISLVSSTIPYHLVLQPNNIWYSAQIQELRINQISSASSSTYFHCFRFKCSPQRLFLQHIESALFPYSDRLNALHIQNNR